MPVSVRAFDRGAISVAEITLSSAPFHVLDLQMCLELSEALRTLRDDDEARIVIIKGADGEFCSGTDIGEHSAEQMPRLLPAFHDCLRDLLKLDAVVIAAISGHCLGGGLELALSCDRIIAEQNSVIGLPEIQLGCYPPAGIVQLLERRCYGQAISMVLSGSSTPVDQLQRAAIVDVIADEGQLEAAVDNEIDRYCHVSPSILAMTVRQFHRHHQRTWGQKLHDIEHDYLNEVLGHPDSHEGIEAFLNKRAPRWAGKQGLVGPDDVAF